MKAWLGFGRTLYIFDQAVLADVLLRVWEHDPGAIEGGLFGGKPTVTLSHGLSVETRAAINNDVYTINGIQRPTAAEIEADAMHAKSPAPQPCRAIVLYKSPVTVKLPPVTPDVIYLPAPFVATVWCETMAA